MTVQRREMAAWLVTVSLLLALPVGGHAQEEIGVLRLALLPQWVVQQHRAGPGWGSREPLVPAFREAVERGVVDRTVFAWQRGAIQRGALVAKPIRILTGEEAGALGGRGDFELRALRPPRGGTAWSEVEILARTGGTDDVVVLEVGGELATLRQVLETLFLLPASGAPQELSLVRPAIMPADGVRVVALPFGRPIAFQGGAPFRGPAGVEFLVIRSQVEVVPNGAYSTNGPADRAVSTTGDWREGDRVLVRMSLTALRSGASGIVLGWKDRLDKSEPDQELILRRTGAQGMVPP